MLIEVAIAGYGAAALAYALFAGYLAWSRRMELSSGAARLFIAAVLTSAAWACTEATAVALRALPLSVASALLDIVRYGCWLGFLLALTGAMRGDTGSGRSVLRWVVPGAVALVALQTVAHLLVDQRGVLSPRWMAASLLCLPLMGLFLAEQVFRGLVADSRWHAKPLCLGVSVVFGFDIYMLSEALMFGRLDPDTLGARGAVHMMAVPILLIGARRRSDWISRLQVSRSAAFHSVTLVLAGLYLLLLSGVGYYVRYFGGSWGGALQLSLVFASVVALAAFGLSGALRARVRVFVGKHFFRHRFDYREQWLRLTNRLAAQDSPQDVGLHVVQGLADMVECPAGSLWTRAEPRAPFTQAARWNMSRSDASEPAESAFCGFLRSKAWVIDLDEFRAAPRRYEGLVLPSWLLAISNSWLVVPLMAGSELLGFVLLVRPRTPIDVNWEVLDLLKTASRQAAGHLAQMQATEALLEARKFDAFNRMSAFVVHDLKNIVTQLSLMLKNAERLHDNREFQQDMLLTVESSLEKMRRLMLQLREGAAPPGGVRGVELRPIVQRLQNLALAQGRTLEVEQREPLATRGHEERLERVLGHLVQNALDATPPDGRVWLQAERYSGQVKIVIGDTGAGMSEEFVQSRLFKPFSSTKGTGMGVGSYESAQYIRELGGSIQVASRLGEGTVMTVLLPLLDLKLGSDLRRADSA